MAGHLLIGLTRAGADRAGDLDGCWQILSQFDLDSDLAFSRMPEAIAMYEACLAYGESIAVSPARLFKLRKVLVRLSSTADPNLIRYAAPTLARVIGITPFDRLDGRVLVRALTDGSR